MDRSDSARELRRRRRARATKRAIDRLDDRERRFSFVASVAAVLFGVVIYFVETNNKNFRLAEGPAHPADDAHPGHRLRRRCCFGATFWAGGRRSDSWPCSPS